MKSNLKLRCYKGLVKVLCLCIKNAWAPCKIINIIIFFCDLFGPVWIFFIFFIFFFYIKNELIGGLEAKMLTSEHAPVDMKTKVLSMYSSAYIPLQRKTPCIGGLRWAIPPMREFCVGYTNMLVSKNPNICVKSLRCFQWNMGF